MLLKKLELKVEMAKPDEASFERVSADSHHAAAPWKAGHHGGPLSEERSASTYLLGFYYS